MPERTPPGASRHGPRAVRGANRTGITPSLRVREAELNEAQRLAGTGSWTWAAGTGAVAWSPELYRITGRDPSERAESLDTCRVLAPESERRLADALESCRSRALPYELDLELVRPDGAVRQVVACGEP